MGEYAIENEPTYCNIINGKCPEKTDGERTYCIYYCQLYSVYTDFERRSMELGGRRIKIGELQENCENCKLIDYCTGPYETPHLCAYDELENINEETNIQADSGKHYRGRNKG